MAGSAIGNAGQGAAVALSGDASTAIVGGPNDNSGLGAAWVFNREPSGWVEQGRLVGAGNVGAANEGRSVALSADGNTAIVGGYADNNNTGAAWVFTRSAGTWSQQARLLGSDAAGNAQQGFSVAVSGDGNTAIVGGPADNANAGAAWVFTRSNGTWTQQGGKLIGSGAIGTALQGISVALSADANTAIVGGHQDDGTGAAWVFTRSGGTWTQQQKLVGTGAVGDALQGWSVALSDDGNTAIVGALGDSNGVGATWVFVRSGGTWSQQGNKLVGSGAIGKANQGYSVALSADGNTAMIGGSGDNNGVGAVWAFTRSNGAWTQLGDELLATDMTGRPAQGSSVALSRDGDTAVVGGPADNNGAGAAWAYVQFYNSTTIVPTATHDLTGDHSSDIVWRHSSGTLALWAMRGNLLGAVIIPTPPLSLNWQIVGQRDFNNDGQYDFLWRDGNTGTLAIWLMVGEFVLPYNGAAVLGSVPGNWAIAGTSDFNYDGNGDILWRDSGTGAVAIWLMDRFSVLQSGTLGTVPADWSIAATDRKGNVFWRHPSSGTVAIWEVYGLQILQNVNLGAVPNNWTIAGVGDFDGNGSTDILWRDTQSGTVAIWLLNGYSVVQTASLGVVPGNWAIVETGDFDGNQMSDILWRDTGSGAVAIWFMNGLQIASATNVASVSTDWTIQGLNAD